MTGPSEPYVSSTPPPSTPAPSLPRLPDQRRSRIAGIGSAVPDWVVKNDDLRRWMDTSDEWIQERTGIRERRWVEPGKGVGASDLGAAAAKKALDEAGIAPREVELVVFATLSPDHHFPGAGPFLQRKLGVPAGAAILDIRQQCTGFIYGLSIADQFVRTGMYSRVLVVGAEVHSTGLDLSTEGRDVSVLFGDGAGAVVVVPAEDERRCILSTHLHADGNSAEDLWAEFPSSKHHPHFPSEMTGPLAGRQFPRMRGKQVFKQAVTRLPETIFEALVRNGHTLADLRMLIPHQANLRINEYAAKLLGLPEERMFHNIQRYGNTTAASIPLALDECRREGRIAEGDLICLAAFGAGFTWGSALLRY
jgi:3-oxoacyl-[acyl-carrier-protein] synthase-3